MESGSKGRQLMSRYRQTFTEAMQLVALTEKEVTKLKNGVKVLGNALPNRAVAQKMADKANKEMGHDADVYQSPFNNRFYVRIKEETIVEFTDAQIKQAYGILNDPRYKQGNYSGAVKVIDKIAPGLSKQPDVANALKRANEELDESFSDAQLQQLKKAYEPMRGKKISIDNANKLGAMFTKFDKNKNALEKLYGGDIPFVSVMAMTRLMTKHGYKAADLKKLGKIRMEEIEILDEATQELVDVTEGKIDAKKFDSLKRGDTMSITYNSTMGGKSTQKFVVKSKSRSAKYNTDKVTMYPDGKPNMSRYFLYKRANGDVSMATGDMAASIMSVEGFTESVEYVEYMAKNSGEAQRIMQMFKGKTGGGEIHKSGSEVRIDSAKNIESIHKQVVAKFPDTNVMTVEDADLEEGMMSKIDAMQKDGKSAADIAKELKLDVKTVKGILGEELGKEDEPKVKKIITKLKGASDAHAGQAKDLEKAMKTEMAKDDAYAIGMSQAKKSMNDEPPLDKKTITKGHKIAKSIMKNEEVITEIGSFSKIHTKKAIGSHPSKNAEKVFYKGLVKSINVGSRNKPPKRDAEIGIIGRDGSKYFAQGEDQAGLKALGKFNTRQDALKAVFNHSVKSKQIKENNSEHPAKAMYEQIKGLKNKSEKSGMPYGILKKVYDRGMAAWRGGHRPGASQQQWAFARVNSFITKSSGTWGGADKDLAAKVKGSK